jgi:integrase
LAAQRILEPYGITVLEAAEYYVSHRERLEKSGTVKQAVRALLLAKKADNLRERYLRDLRLRLRRFEADFGNRLLADITPVEVESWLRSLSLAPLGRNTYQLRLNLLFEFGHKCGWVSANPLSNVAKAKVRESLPGILTVEQVARLLEAAGESTLPFWGLGLFGGLRTAELTRMEWENVHFGEASIAVPSNTSKTGSRRFVTMQPNLLEWLAPYRAARGPVCPPNLRERLEADRARAGITEWPSNAARHSFGCYHLAWFQNAALTALQMGHMRTDVLFRHYNQRVRPTEAERFWRIVPSVEGGAVLAVAAA